MLALTLATPGPSPISTDWQQNLIALLLFALLALSVWEKLKRKPPLEDTFATKKEQEGGDARLQMELERLDERTRTEINALDRRTQENIRAMNDVGEKRAQANRDLIQDKIGGLQKALTEKIVDNRDSNTSAFGKIEGRLDSFQVTIQGLSNDVMHQIGSLEGQLKEVAKRVE